MAKQGGMGDLYVVDQFDLSGDTQSLGNVGGGPAPSDFTTIDKSAMVRQGLLKDGRLSWVSFFNPDAIGPPIGAHAVLKTLPYTDRQVAYCVGRAQGNPCFSMLSKQINYDGTRGQDASFTFAVDVQANGFGAEWGEQLTAGLRTDTTATSPATGLDFGAVSTLFGWTAYLHVLSITGTSVTVTVQDSADNAAFTTLTGGAFTAVATVATNGAQRLTAASQTATVRRYVRVITTGTFTNAVFLVSFVRYLTAQT